jgi:beta-lactamase class A
MQSVFKAILGAAALAEVDAGRLSLDETIRLTDADISPPYSPVADAYPGRRDYTVAELLTLAVGGSDNTAADVRLRRIGGPGAVTAWLVNHDIKEVRVDRYERQLQTEIVGLASFRTAWKGEAAFVAALREVPAIERRAATARYLGDPQDTATPRGVLTFLYKLNAGELLSPSSTRRLLQIMTETQTGAARIKAGLPAGSKLAHKTGTARTDLGVNPAINDIGIVSLPDGRRYAVAIFLSGSTAGEADRDAILAAATRALVRAMR